MLFQIKGGKQDKMIPNLIFSIEELERHLVKLGKKAKVSILHILSNSARKPASIFTRLVKLSKKVNFRLVYQRSCQTRQESQLMVSIRDLVKLGKKANFWLLLLLLLSQVLSNSTRKPRWVFSTHTSCETHQESPMSVLILKHLVKFYSARKPRRVFLPFSKVRSNAPWKPRFPAFSISQ